MNKGFIKLSIIFGALIGLISLIGYLFLAGKAQAFVSEYGANEWSNYCADNPGTCDKDEDGASGEFYVECPGDGQVLYAAAIHAGDGQTVYFLPEEGFDFYYDYDHLWAWNDGHPHDISWLMGFCEAEEITPTPTEEPSPTPTDQPTPTPTEEPSPTPTEEPQPSVTPTPEPTPTETPSPTPTPEEKTHVCLDDGALNFDEDFDQEKEVGDPEVCEYEEVTPTPTPEATPTPEQPRGTTEASAPQCTDHTPLVLPSNVHVVRSGSDATVNFFTQSSNANIYYKNVESPVWQYSARDIPVTGGYVSYTIHALNPSLGYTFAVQAANSCAGGETVLAVIVDGPASVTFPLTYWEWMK